MLTAKEEQVKATFEKALPNLKGDNMIRLAGYLEGLVDGARMYEKERDDQSKAG
jgi:hypothetical protein